MGKFLSSVDYLININNRKKIFHINMLRNYYDRPDFLKWMIDDADEEVEKGNSLIILPDNQDKKEDIPNTIEFAETNQLEMLKFQTIW